VYEDAYALAVSQINNLKEAVVKAGFCKDDLKTTSFNVDTAYEKITDTRGNSRKVFDGYSCLHRLKLSFDMDTGKLSKVLSAISESDTEPELSVQFTLKDRDEVEAALLASAAKNARDKAVVLCEAMGAKLGQLIRIDYNWEEIDIISRVYCDCSAGVQKSMDFTPDDIDVADNATFVWEIE